MQSFRFYIGVSAVLIALIFLAGRELSLQPDGKLHVHFLDIGQGDSTLIVSPSGKQILIDGGPNLDALEHIGRYMPFFDRSIELLILSHQDADHITALPEVLRRYNIQQVLINGTQGGSARYDSFLHEIASQGIGVILTNPESDIDMGDGLVFDIVWPKQDVFAEDGIDVNYASVVVRALYSNHLILLTGDIDAEAESAILASGADITSDIIKVPHHGSKTSSSTGFILAVDPDLAVISVGAENSFGHPHQEVLDRYTSMGVEMRSTEEGTVSLSF